MHHAPDVWQPSWGAWRDSEGVRFRVWAPGRRRVDVVLEAPQQTNVVATLTPAADGSFSAVIPHAAPGDRYRYRLDGEGPYPDPASRFQPDGVHGPSAIIDPCSFSWTDAGWRGVRLNDLVVYELHVGTFTPAGTFAGMMHRLPYLRDLGVTAIEVMPVADFAGSRNWGYDGVAWFAPARCYGQPDDLRRLVDNAHGLGLAVILDVVFNHVGPDGAYLATFSPYYFSTRHQTPWGDAINLDGPHSETVRSVLLEAALHWLHEYHIDGLRLDATHALIDDSPQPFLAELTSRIRTAVSGREVVLIAEDHRNLADMVRPVARGGWGLDGVWADDFHHQTRRALAGDRDGYYRDFSGSLSDLATTLRRGWFYCGQHSQHFGAARGTDPAGLAPSQFVICLDNHDQIGNRAFGERLHHQIDLATYRAASVLLLCAPQTPLLFMGQEWAASAPFQYFTDHNPQLGKLITEGRRREFKEFSAFSDPQARARIPDPQDPATFVRSRLDWSEAEREPHAALVRLYHALLRLRRTEPLLRAAGWNGFGALAVNEHCLLLRKQDGSGTLLVVIHLRHAGSVNLREPFWQLPHASWQILLSSEDQAFAVDAIPIRVDLDGSWPEFVFARPGALILKRARV
ncbi:MAG: malto-oligosyltrehalose trehalohydrolase [Deltaproteobacteria bacterium]|nr:malto-oligosyltrehalose trehalohydrolase [Deltaproteobacteria bacterium]